MVKYFPIIGLTSILALQALLPNVNLVDMTQLRAFYKVYRDASSQFAFGTFLRLHYDNPDHSVPAPPAHQDLPFSKRGHHRANGQIAHLPEYNRIQTTHFFLLKVEGEFAHAIHTNSIILSIWRPPRA